MKATQVNLKQAAAQAAIDYIGDHKVIGVGTGSTVNFFIDALKPIASRLEGAVASSEATAERLKAVGVPLLDLNSAGPLPLYVDGADEANHYKQLIKGGGGALTREKIIAAAAKQFVCIIDESKYVPYLGKFPLPIEVLPMARSYVARECVKLGADPCYREGVITDNGNVILDVQGLNFEQPQALEAQLNQITGIVCHGLFATRPADVLINATAKGVEIR